MAGHIAIIDRSVCTNYLDSFKCCYTDMYKYFLTEVNSLNYSLVISNPMDYNIVCRP